MSDHQSSSYSGGHVLDLCSSLAALDEESFWGEVDSFTIICCYKSNV